LYEVEADAGRLEPNDSLRRESIFVTWSPKIYHEARDGAPNIIDWVFDEDRSTIRTGFGPENMTRLRRFAIGLIKSKGIKGVSNKCGS